MLSLEISRTAVKMPAKIRVFQYLSCTWGSAETAICFSRIDLHYIVSGEDTNPDLEYLCKWGRYCQRNVDFDVLSQRYLNVKITSNVGLHPERDD